MKRSTPLKRTPMKRAAPKQHAEPRKRKCKVCGTAFRPVRGIQSWCSPECGVTLAGRLVAKKEDRDHRTKLADSKPLSHWIELTEAVVHKYIHARDRGLPCISCGTRRTVQWEAGHYLSKGARPELRFVLNNIHLQCHRCNEHLSGNQIQYRIGLVEKIGEASVQELEGPHLTAKFTREGLAEMRRQIAALTRQLLREREACAA